MKYNLITNGSEGFDVITDDGGFAQFYISDGEYKTMYYGNRWTDAPDNMDVWDYISEGKSYIRDWDCKPNEQEALMDALNWLVVPAPDEWVLDTELFVTNNIKQQ